MPSKRTRKWPRNVEKKKRIKAPSAATPRTYWEYIGVDPLLNGHQLTSDVADEHVFIFVHKHCELCFGQMTFDLEVIARTLDETIPGTIDERIRWISNDVVWGDALRATNRLLYNAEVVLPTILLFLQRTRGRESMFSALEFARFREGLTPASGFQSAQFRFIQRALGKGPIIDGIESFDGGLYVQAYGEPSGTCPMAVTDERILKSTTSIAKPDRESKRGQAGDLDKIVHNVLASFAPLAAETPPGVRLLPHTVIEDVLAARLALATQPIESSEQVSIDALRSTLESFVSAENERRAQLGNARRGAAYLTGRVSPSHLNTVLTGLIEFDHALHDDRDGFLGQHYRVAADVIEQIVADAAASGKGPPSKGTGGGGLAYLRLSAEHLLPLVPVAIAYRDMQVD